MTKQKTIIFFSLFSLISFLFFQNLNFVKEPEVSKFTENAALHVSFNSYTRLPTNFDSVSVIFCMARLKFKTIQDFKETIDNSGDSNIVKNIFSHTQELSISPLGTDLGFIDVPFETYRQIEFLLSGNHCESDKSIQIVNAHGTFSSDSEIKLKFNGFKPIGFLTAELQLAIVPIIQVLSTIRSNKEIKTKLEAVNGWFN